MAAAKKCDICGTLYECYGIARAASEVNKNLNGIVFISKIDESKFYTGKSIDCCPGCLNSIKNHINGLKGE